MEASDKYEVLSPDKITIGYVPTIDKAKEAVKNWGENYKIQGYYSANYGRIPLADLEEHCTLIEL